MIAWTSSSSKGPWQKSSTVRASFRTCEVLSVSTLLSGRAMSSRDREPPGRLQLPLELRLLWGVGPHTGHSQGAVSNQTVVKWRPGLRSCSGTDHRENGALKGFDPCPLLS